MDLRAIIKRAQGAGQLEIEDRSRGSRRIKIALSDLMAVDAAPLTFAEPDGSLGRYFMFGVSEFGGSDRFGGAFDPPRLEGLVLWLDADHLELDDGDPVATWPDASGQGNDAASSGSARPTFRADEGGHAAVEFDGSDDYMVMAGLTLNPSAESFCVVAVLEEDVSDQTLGIVAQPHPYTILFKNSQNKYASNLGGTIRQSDSAWPSGMWRVVTMKWSGAEVQFRIDGVADGGGDLSPGAETDPWVLGANGALAARFAGRMRSALVFSPALHERHLALTEDWLMERWGV